MPAEREDMDLAARGVPLPSLGALYTIALTFAILGSMAAEVFAVELPGVLKAGNGRPGLGFAFFLGLLLVAAGAGLRVLVGTGPVGLTRAALTWCLGSPGLSAWMHRRAFWSRVAAAAVVLGVAGLAAVLVVGSALGTAGQVGTVAGAIVVGAAATVLAAAGQVRAGTRRADRRASGLLLAAGLLVWYLASFAIVPIGSGAGRAVAVVVLVGVLAPALVLGRRVLRALRGGGIPLDELLRAGDVVDRLTAATIMLSALPLKRAPAPRPAIRLGRLPVRARTRPAWIALVDARRILARPGVLLLALALVPLTASIARLVGDPTAALLLTVLGFALAGRVADWYRSWVSTPSLRLLLPAAGRSTAFALLAAPALVVAVFAAASALLAGLPGWWIGTVTLAAVAGTHRKARQEGREAAGQLLVATPAGGIPVFVVLRLAAGWDIAVVAGLLGFVLPPVVVLDLTAVAAAVLLSLGEAGI